VNCWSASWNSGAIRMPPIPASIIVSTHAADEVRDALTPRSPARSRRLTTARISRPRRECRSTIQSARAATAAAMNTATWSELSDTWSSPIALRWNVLRGYGPIPRTVAPPPLPVVVGRSKPRTVLPSASTSHSASAGSAIRRPIDPTMRAYTGAAARRRRRIRSRARPSKGANTSTDSRAAGITGTPSPVFIWKKK